MPRSRFDLMIESDIEDTDGEKYPDVLTFPLQDFEFKETAIGVLLREPDINRFDAFMFNVYKTSDYDDTILFLSQLETLYDAEVGDDILLPTKADIERFFSENKI